MSTFRPGQRVRIVKPQSLFFGREATVIKFLGVERYIDSTAAGNIIKRGAIYHVSVDGYGDHDDVGYRVVYMPYHLEPLLPPLDLAALLVAKDLPRGPVRTPSLAPEAVGA